MFWKKKNDNAIAIELDSDEQRNGIRIQPLDEMLIYHEAQTFKLLDISFMGLAFAIETPDTFNNNESIEVSLSLPIRSMPDFYKKSLSITCLIRVVQSHGKTCHCQFVNLTHQAQLLIDQFILNEQKRQIHNQVK